MTDKLKKPRRTRVDSTQGVANAIVAGGKKINVPPEFMFTPKERLVFTELCNEFSKSELTAHKIRLVGILARDMVMLDRAQEQLRAEGPAFVNSHGNQTANPLLRVVQTLSATVLAMRRSLGVHARELAGGDNRRTAIMREHNKRNEGALSDDDDFARPNVVPFGRREEHDDDGE